MYKSYADSIIGEEMSNSHIQVPKSIISNFVSKDGSLFYFDFREKIEAKKVKRGYAKKLYTEEGYYSSSVEKILNKEIETPLNNLIKKINDENFLFNHVFSEDEYKTIEKYANSLLIRGTHFKNEIYNNSLSLQLFYNETSRNDITVVSGLSAIEKHGISRNAIITFAYNNTDLPFVLPMGGLTYLFHDNEIVINVPLTPKISALIIKEPKYNYFDENGKPIIIKYHLSDVMYINTMSFYDEKKFNKVLVASASRDELRRIRIECEKLIFDDTLRKIRKYL